MPFAQRLCVCARAFVRQVVPELELSQGDRVYSRVDVTRGKILAGDEVVVKRATVRK